MTEILKWASKGEAAVARALVSEILAQDCKVRVHDGEEWATTITNDEQKILEALCSTGGDVLCVYQGKDKVYHGSYALIYGNADDGSELIADWTCDELLDKIINNIGYMEV